MYIYIYIDQNWQRRWNKVKDVSFSDIHIYIYSLFCTLDYLCSVVVVVFCCSTGIRAYMNMWLYRLYILCLSEKNLHLGQGIQQYWSFDQSITGWPNESERESVCGNGILQSILYHLIKIQSSYYQNKSFQFLQFPWYQKWPTRQLLEHLELHFLVQHLIPYL